MITIFISSAKSTTRSISSSTIIYSKFSTYETSTMTLSTTIVSSTYMPSTKPPYETTQLSTVSTLTSLVTSTIKPSTTAETSTKVSTLIGHSTTGLPIRPSTSKESRVTKVSSPTSPSSTMVSTYMTSLPTVIETIDNSLIFSSATSPSFSETYFTEGDFFKWLFNQFCI